jgi:uncharacterized SAM-binding protein YcdF (DUF218 family)
VTANYLLWQIVAPSQLIVLVALLAVVWWRRPLGRKLGLLAAGLVILFGLVPTGAWLIGPLETRFGIPDITGDVAGVIVLAGSERVTLSDLYSEPQLSSAGDRLTTFLRLAARFPQARLVHSGNVAESPIARSLILGTGVAAERIRFDDQSTNTCGSARTTRALVEPQAGERWLLVTSSVHMPRAVACFRAVGWEVIPYPTDFRRGTNPLHFGLVKNLEDLDAASHEWLGLVYYRLRGYTNELFPAPSRL